MKEWERKRKSERKKQLKMYLGTLCYVGENVHKRKMRKFMTISRPAAFSSILSIHLLCYPITQHILHYNAPMVELIVKNGKTHSFS